MWIFNRFKTAPYWIHLTVDTAITQGIWWGVSKMLTTPAVVQSIIAGVILIATIFAVALYLPKISPVLSVTSKTKPITNSDVGWWASLAEGDKQDIKHRVPLRDTHADIEYVKKTGYCCVRFVFSFINATVYKVVVRQQFDGDIYADRMKLPNKLTVDMKEDELIFTHGIGFGLRCSLPINEPYLQELIKLSGKTVRFELQRTKIMADLIDPTGQKAGEFRIEIPHRTILDVPDLTTDHQLMLRRIDLSRE